MNQHCPWPCLCSDNLLALHDNLQKEIKDIETQAQELSDSIHLLTFSEDTKPKVSEHIVTLQNRINLLKTKQAELLEHQNSINSIARIINWPVIFSVSDLETALSYLEARISNVYDKIINDRIQEKDLEMVRLHIRNIKERKIVENPKDWNT
jgi:chromosome segregation ATPase